MLDLDALAQADDRLAVLAGRPEAAARTPSPVLRAPEPPRGCPFHRGEGA